jgi:hypothetical protein
MYLITHHYGFGGTIVRTGCAFDTIFRRDHNNTLPVYTEDIIGTKGDTLAAHLTERFYDVRPHWGNHKWFEGKNQTLKE